jgi:hypothetical protein
MKIEESTAAELSEMNHETKLSRLPGVKLAKTPALREKEEQGRQQMSSFFFLKIYGLWGVWGVQHMQMGHK